MVTPAHTNGPEGLPVAAAVPQSGPISHAPTSAHASPTKLVLMAIGVVFGDIGTSPLYALKECVDPDHGVAPTEQNLLGLLSLVFWSWLWGPVGAFLAVPLLIMGLVAVSHLFPNDEPALPN